VALATQNLDIPVEVIIPSINLDLKVDPGTIKNGIWQTSDSTATFLDTSSTPGSTGNTVIYGHNKKIIFGNLPYLSTGQRIIVKTRSGQIYNYIVENKYFVDPGRIDLVSPTNNSQLTIFTCWGAFDQQRAVIKAVPVK
jgi:LPXTG-site transpeptidase (sortase) family protein